MSAASLLADVVDRGVQLWAEGDELCLRAPQGSLTPDLRERLKAQKAEVLALLGQHRKHAPVAYTQRRLWFLENLEPNTAAYHMHLVFRLAGDLDAAALEASIRAIIARHDTLRTRFLTYDDCVVQVIDKELPFTLAHVDLSDRAEAEALAQAETEAETLAERPFDLTDAPMLRATLITVQPNEFRLVVIMHHIVSDAWSTQVFIRELVQGYTAQCKNSDRELPPLSVQYADCVVKQSAWLDEHLVEEEDYWTKQLAGDLPVLDLPTDRPRPAVQTFNGARRSLVLPATLRDALKAFSQDEGVTLFTTTLAAFQVLMHRYTGLTDVLVGSPIAGRGAEGADKLIGYFANTVVQRADLEGDPTFRDFLQQVRGTVLDAQAHQDMPFEKLVELLKPERDMAHTPIFQVMFALQNVRRAALTMPGLEVERMPLDTGRAKFDLVLMVTERDGLRANFEYNTDLFDADTVDRMLAHYETLLEGIVADSSRKISALPIIPRKERSELLALGQGKDLTVDTSAGVHCLVEAHAATTPDAPAIATADHQLSYGQLNARANKLAHWLQDAGILPESKVAACLANGPNHVVALLAILKAGGAYVPLDPTYPEERLAFMLEDSGAQVLLTQSSFSSRLPKHEATTLRLDTEWDAVETLPEDNPNNAISPEQLAYVIYTSGSTGKPKGVEATHRSLHNLIAWHNDAFGVTASDRATLIASPAFDASVWETWPYLTAGAGLHVPDEETRITPDRMRDWLFEKKITVAFAPTPLAERMLLLEWPTDTKLRYLLTGGDKLTITPNPALSFALVNNYGPTENTVVTTSGAVPTATGDEKPSTAPSIGRPVANNTVYILDTQLHSVPKGVPGELYVGGASLARGYLNRPELTAERFVASPYEANGKLYRTGDIVRWRNDGEIEFIGRADDQVKVRGYRIELGEIEAALAAHPDVKQALAMVDSASGDKRLVGYVASPASDSLEPAALRAFALKTLPDYMTPNTYVILDQFPVTAAGKIDRKALPKPETGASNGAGTDYLAPRDSAEHRLVRIWEKLFDIEPIGVTDNFFDLGGHSFLAVRLMGDISREFEQELPLSTLFEAPTVEGMASLLRAQTADGDYPSLVPIRRTGSRPPFFCIHPAPGTVFGYTQLVNELGPEQPFYALQAPGVNGECDPLDTVDAMAERYLAEIQAHQPQGPYLLGGHSSGGIVALEIAHRLRQQGQEVALLTLIDAPAPLPGVKSKRVYTTAIEHTRDALWLAGLSKLVATYFKQDRMLTYTELDAAGDDEQFEMLLRQFREVDFVPPDTQSDLVRNFFRVTQANFHAAWGYSLAKYDGRVAIFQSSTRFGMLPDGARMALAKIVLRLIVTRPGLMLSSFFDALKDLRAILSRRNDPSKGWNSFDCQGVDEFKVSGNHVTMLTQPHVKELAKAISKAIEETDFPGQTAAESDAPLPANV
jgi:amino acid adenylation domain-containing protein